MGQIYMIEGGHLNSEKNSKTSSKHYSTGLFRVSTRRLHTYVCLKKSLRFGTKKKLFKIRQLAIRAKLFGKTEL